MEWINLPNNGDVTDDICSINICWDRDEACGDKNSCGIKLCITRYCVINY